MSLEPYIPLNQLPVEELLSLVDRPVHTVSCRDAGCDNVAGTVSLAAGVCLSGAEGVAGEDFLEFLRVGMQIGEFSSGMPVLCRIDRKLARPGKYESCRITVTPERVLVEAEDRGGLSRALLLLENTMRRYRAPLLPLGVMRDSTFERLRISRSPVASYRFGGGWELLRDEDFYSDHYFNTLRRVHINAIWVAGLFREMIHSDVLPELTPEADERALTHLKTLTERAARFGVKVFFFCMEPRALEKGHPVFAAHPELLGTVAGDPDTGAAMMCSSHPTLLAYLTEAIGTLFRRAPLLGGMIQIFAGERATGCRSIDAYLAPSDRRCPRCAVKTQAEGLSDLIEFQFRTMREVAPQTDYLVWSYGIPVCDVEVKLEVYRRIPREVVWLENFEHGVVKKFAGKSIVNEEYSLSCAGPSPAFAAVARLQTPETPPVWPKFQFGNTYELSLVPYIPVPSMAWRKQRVARASHCSGALVSWILGGWNDLMLQAFALADSGRRESERDFLTRLAATLYPPQAVDAAVRSWIVFDRAFQKFPCDINIYYYGPIARAPGYLLQLTGERILPPYPYNWGMDRRRRVQPWFTPDPRWTGESLSAMEIAGIFRKIAGEFRRGVELLRHPALTGVRTVAESIRIMLDSAANVYEFYELRQEPSKRKRLLALAAAELANAEAMRPLLRRDPRIGFHSEMLFRPVSEEILVQKIDHTKELIHILTARRPQTISNANVVKKKQQTA